jgi:hypothetical protein
MECLRPFGLSGQFGCLFLLCFLLGSHIFLNCLAKLGLNIEMLCMVEVANPCQYCANLCHPTAGRKNRRLLYIPLQRNICMSVKRYGSTNAGKNDIPV